MRLKLIGDTSMEFFGIYIKYLSEMLFYYIPFSSNLTTGIHIYM